MRFQNNENSLLVPIPAASSGYYSARSHRRVFGIEMSEMFHISDHTRKHTVSDEKQQAAGYSTLRFFNKITIALLILILLAGCFGNNPAKIKNESPQRSNNITIQQNTTENPTTRNEAITSPPAAKISAISCTDLDGGISPASKGSTVIKFSDGSTNSTPDQCVTVNAVIEHSCNGAALVSQTILCANGCKDGECQSGSASLKQYPSFYEGDDKLKISIGDSAPVQHTQAAIDIATSLTAALNRAIEAKPSSEISDPFAQSLIVIGNACQNPTAAMLLGGNQTCADDVVGQGKITLVKVNGKNYIFITGGNTDDVRKAARVLSKYNDYFLSGESVKVGGSLSSPTIIT